MLGSVALEVGIGLVLCFSLFSVLMTSVRESLESLLKTRSKLLEQTIGELLKGGEPPATDTATKTLVQMFYNSPLISPMFKGDYDENKRKLPSYIPAASFAAAVVHLDEAGATLPGHLNGLVRRLVGVSAEQGAGVQAQLEAWYDSAMDRVSGRYKRQTQAWLFALSFLVAVVGNINPIAIGDQLASDQKLRTGIGALASTYADDTAPPATRAAVDQLATKMAGDLTAAGLPVGWKPSCDIVGVVSSDAHCYAAGGGFGRSLAGWLVAAAAAMLGAPFWFDMLNKLVNLRAAVKPGTPASTKTAVAVVSDPALTAGAAPSLAAEGDDGC